MAYGELRLDPLLDVLIGKHSKVRKSIFVRCKDEVCRLAQEMQDF